MHFQSLQQILRSSTFKAEVWALLGAKIVYNINHTLHEFIKTPIDEKKEKEKKKNTILKELTVRILLEKQRLMEMQRCVRKGKETNVYCKLDTVVSVLMTIMTILKHLLCSMGFSNSLPHPHRKSAK